MIGNLKPWANNLIHTYLLIAIDMINMDILDILLIDGFKLWFSSINVLESMVK